MAVTRGYFATSMLVLLATARLAVTSGNVFPICTSTCEDPVANELNSGTVPCSITPTCASGSPVPLAGAPGSPRNVTLQSDATPGPDNRYYLSITSQWYASEDRISELTGFEVNVLCLDSGCSSSESCFTMSFNRTLTPADAGIKFSVRCLFGNFSIPEKEYSVIARSLPRNIQDSNRVEERISLPSCSEDGRVALCRVSMVDWELKKPEIFLLGPRTVVVNTRAAAEDRDYLDVRYEVYLQNSYTYEPIGPEYTNISHDVAKFDDVPNGNYRALMRVSECDDCTLYTSSTTITIPALLYGPTLRESSSPPPSTTTTHTSQTPREDTSYNIPSPPGFALILYVIGGCLGGILLVLTVTAMACSKKFHDACCGVVIGRRNGPVIEPSIRSSIHSNNGRYELATDTGSMYIEKLSNSHHDYYMDSSVVDNPSMIPQTAHEDWKHNEKNLLRESNRYAEMIGQGRGDSISTTALDIQSTVTVPSSVQMDSGFRTCSDIAEEDGERVLSLALTDIGESV
ncbi:uncharacterized protein [Diadema antillarum]|uniref:uncharacterized protein n=1 Tax=Diadema antillarum TaxID=105358 RepID=UPI003A8BEFAA